MLLFICRIKAQKDEITRLQTSMAHLVSNIEVGAHFPRQKLAKLLSWVLFSLLVDLNSDRKRSFKRLPSFLRLKDSC